MVALGPSVAPAVLSNLVINGAAGNGAAIQGRPSAALTNVVIANSCPANPGVDGPFEGNGLYVNKTLGGVRLTSCAFLFNGRPTSSLPWGVTPNATRHGLYADVMSGPVTATDCLFAGNAADGAQTRQQGQAHTFTNCLFWDNAIHLEAVMGTANLINCLLIGSHYTWTGNAWTNQIAIKNYNPVGLNDVSIVGVVGQGAYPASTLHPGTADNTFPQGAIVSGGAWENTGETFAPPAPGVPLLTLTGTNIVQGWPGPLYAGASPQEGAGVKEVGSGAITLPPAIPTLIATLIADPTSDVKATIAAIRALIVPLIGK